MCCRVYGGTALIIELRSELSSVNALMLCHAQVLPLRRLLRRLRESVGGGHGWRGQRTQCTSWAAATKAPVEICNFSLHSCVLADS